MVVDSPSVCTLTRQFVQGSARYQALSAPAKRVVDAAVTGACVILTKIGPQTLPSKKPQFIQAYKDAVGALGSAGWLTAGQVATLRSLADGL